MHWKWATTGVVLAALAGGASCFPEDDGGGGGGGISGFERGFVFLRADDRNVYIADQSDLQTIARLTTGGDNRHPSLSPDGRSVVFVHGDSEIQRVAVAGSTPATLFAASDGESRVRSPVYSPDGERIAFTFDRGASTLLAVMNADGSGFVEVSSGGLSYASPTFYPDGQHVLVAAGSSTALTQLEKVNLDTGFAQNLGSLGSGLSVQTRVALSPDGTRAVFDARVGLGSRIFVLDLAGSPAARQLTDYSANPTAQDSHPAWTGNGEVTFSSDDGGNDQVYRLSASATMSAGALVLPGAVEPWFGPL